VARSNAKDEKAKDQTSKDASKDDDEAKKAGQDQSKDVQTTDEAAENKESQPTGPEESGETNVEGAAKGEVAGGVVRGDSGDALDEDVDLADEVDGALGTVVETDRDGKQYDVPYVLVTSDHLPRTSDSDDAAKDWTAQHAGGEREDEDGNSLDPVALVPVEGTPGQTFRVGELPNREVAEKAGIDYDVWVSGLPVRPDVPREAPRRGIPA
jgi:hypothetical protein